MVDRADSKYWKSIFDPSCSLELKYITMDDQTEVLVVISEPPNIYEGGNKSLILIPGWFSIPTGWVEVTQPLSKEIKIYYVETREKSSSITVSKKVEMDVSRLSLDFETILLHLKIDFPHSVVVASSLAGSLLFEFLSRTRNKPFKTVLIGPNPDYKLPPIIGRVLLLMPMFLFQIAKKYVKWHVLKFRIDKEKEPEQAAKFIEALDAAEPWKIRKSGKSVVKFNGWDLLEKIDVDTILIGASSDKLHEFETTEKIGDLMPNATVVNFGTNKAIHSGKMGSFLLDLCKGIDLPKIEKN